MTAVFIPPAREDVSGREGPGAGKEKRNPGLHLAVMMLLAILAATVLGYTAKPMVPENDALQYLTYAYHLAHHGTYADRPEGPRPGDLAGREPLYSALISAMMRFDPKLGSVSLSCIVDIDPSCRDQYRSLLHLNVGLYAAAAVLVFAAVLRLTGSVVPAYMAGLYLLLNLECMKWRSHIISDYLAVFLVAVVALALVRAVRSRRLGAWLALGVALGLLTLTKAIYLYFTLTGVAVMIGIGLVDGARRGRFRRLAAAAALLAGFMPLAGGWMARNALVLGAPVLTEERSGLSLNSREVFNHMTGPEYAVAFLYWTRGFGDDLARRLLPAEHWRRFEWETPDGFHVVGQHGYEPKVARAMSEHRLSRRDAMAHVDGNLRAILVGAGPTHLATTLPLFYRGIWIDTFAVFGLPALAWLLGHALRRRDGGLLAVLSPGVFSLVFYALLSVGIPRLQMTALPTLAMAAALAAQAIGDRLRRSRGDGQAGG